MPFRTDKRRMIRTPVSYAAYYSDGVFHASGMTENLTGHGGCLHGSHAVKVGMELVVLLIPSAKHALMIKKATVRWAGNLSFGVELDKNDCGTVEELGYDSPYDGKSLPSLMTH